eukprot:4851563-Prorocentrum_lima.AAC.1
MCIRDSRTKSLARKVREHGIKLPDAMQGWMLLRLPGLNEAQRQLVMAQCGVNLSFKNMAATLQIT